MKIISSLLKIYQKWRCCFLPLLPEPIQIPLVQPQPRNTSTDQMSAAPMISMVPLPAAAKPVNLPKTYSKAGPPLTIDTAIPCPDTSKRLKAYLEQQENDAAEISRLEHILDMSNVILEIGCGMGEAARQIAEQNPHMGVIATDLYDWTGSKDCSHYQRIAHAWRERRLAVQQHFLDNLVVLRADCNIVNFLPDQCIDSILLINPEPKVAETFLTFLIKNGLAQRIKPGPRQLVIVPYSREMGIMACGGLEFDHRADWSKGLGFLFESDFEFSKGARKHWGVDLATVSPYTKNSTQTDVYCAGCPHDSLSPRPVMTRFNLVRKLFQ